MADLAGPSFGELLRCHRLDANLTQEALAARSHLSVQAIGMLERGTRRSPRRDTVVRLSRALRLSPSQTEALLTASDARRAGLESTRSTVSLPTEAVPPHGPLPAGSHMPLAPNPLFVGRVEELLQVAAALKGGDTVALGQVVAFTGLGGLGKTQLAAEFVHRYGRFFSGGVFWLSFASGQEIPLQVAACASPGFEGGRSLEERVKLVQTAWLGAQPRLLVFDNCEEEALLQAWRPVSGGCRVLVTSRRSYWSPTLGVATLPLDLLPRADSIELLRRYRPDLAPDDPGLVAIARALGDLPLALHLAGSYLRAYRADVSLDEYSAEMCQPAVIRHASLLGAGLDNSPSPTHHVQSLAQTFSLCLGRLDREREVDRVAIALLARIACLAPGEAVPRDLLGRTLGEVEPLRRADGLRRLAAVGLVEEGEGWLRLHRLLVQFVRQEGLDPQAQPAVCRALIDCGTAAQDGHLTGPTLATVIPHLVDVASRDTGDEPRRAGLCNAAGLGLLHVGDLPAAEPWLERALEIRGRVLGTDHADTAQSFNDLGELRWTRGELSAAKILFERALAIRERVLGPEHPQTAVSLNNLAVVLWHQGEFAAARALHDRALALHRRLLGPEHPETAVSLNNLALVLRDQGEFAAARAMDERALAIRERVLGPEHRDTAHSLNDLAAVLRDQGRFAAARALHDKALAIRERVLGAEHRDTALSLGNLAVVLRDQGEFAAARPLQERALAIRERVLGAEHHETALSLNNLAVLLRDQGELAAARALHDRALAIRERVLGPDHPRTADSLHNLAVVLRDQGELAAARALHERALAIRERVLGPDHPHTAQSLNQLATLLQAQGELAATQLLLQRALAIREGVLGPDHPDTATSLNDLAALHQAQGEPGDARRLFERALAIREQVLGPEHPDTAATRRKVAIRDGR
jgi:tetratricopeptide (TPR) repeat protein/transcriptional regulator with XRE-family HTH domain